MRIAKWTVDRERRGGAAHSEVALRRGARPLPQIQRQPRAECGRLTLRIRPAAERRLIDDVAVEDRHGAVGILGPACRMHQPSHRHAVDRLADVPEVAAADGEFAAEVVAGRHPRQRLNRAIGIVGEDAAQIPQLRARQRLTGRRGRVPRAKTVGDDRDLLHVTADAVCERNRDLRRAVRLDVDERSREAVADERDKQLLRFGGHLVQAKLAVGPRHGRQRRILNRHGHARQRRACALVDDRAVNGPGPDRRGRRPNGGRAAGPHDEPCALRSRRRPQSVRLEHFIEDLARNRGLRFRRHAHLRPHQL